MLNHHPDYSNLPDGLLSMNRFWGHLPNVHGLFAGQQRKSTVGGGGSKGHCSEATWMCKQQWSISFHKPCDKSWLVPLPVTRAFNWLPTIYKQALEFWNMVARMLWLHVTLGSSLQQHSQNFATDSTAHWTLLRSYLSMQTAMEHKPSQKSWLVTLRVHSIDFPQNMQTGSGMVCAGMWWHGFM